MRDLILLALLLAACHTRKGPLEPIPEVTHWASWPNLVDVACNGSGATCVVLDDKGAWLTAPTDLASRVRLDCDTQGVTGLTVENGAVMLVADCPDIGRCARPLPGGEPAAPNGLPMMETPSAPAEEDQDGQASLFAHQFSVATRTPDHNVGRIGFYRLVGTPDDGRVALLAGGGSTLIRTGGGHGLKAIRLGLDETIQPWPATLSLHPTGQELYVLSWPDGTLRALDPLTLSPHWTLPLDSPAFGLYVDGGGRYLLGQLGVVQGSGSDESPGRIGRWPEPDGAASDDALRVRDAPPVSGTFAVDLATRSVALAIPGQFRRAIPIVPAGDATQDAGLLVATTDAIQYIPPSPRPPPPAGPAPDPLTP